MTGSWRTLGWLLIGAVVVPGMLAGPQAAVAVEVGEAAPDFKLASTRGVDVGLAEFKGKKWVFLEFYGGDFHPS